MLAPRFVAVALAVLALSPPAARAAAPTFVMITINDSNYFESCFEGFSAAGAKYGLTVRRVVPSKADAAEQAALVDQAVADHVNGIAVSAVDDAGLAPAIARAAAAGIPVVTFDSPAPSSPALTYIGTDNRAAGAEAGRRLASLLRKGAKVLVTQRGLSAANLNQRAAGAREALAAAGVKVVAVADISGDDATASARTEEALRAHPEVNAVLSVSAAGAPAAAAAVARLERAGKVIVAGFDDRPATLEGIRAGTIQFCVVQSTFKMGWYAVRGLLEATGGRKLPARVNTGVVLVTRANVDTYVDDMRRDASRRAGR